ncbi:MAG: GNAT family N-acetyltransferase [Candidatus Asgardarchaeia archaeon]
MSLRKITAENLDESIGKINKLRENEYEYVPFDRAYLNYLMKKGDLFLLDLEDFSCFFYVRKRGDSLHVSISLLDDRFFESCLDKVLDYIKKSYSSSKIGFKVDEEEHLKVGCLEKKGFRIKGYLHHMVCEVDRMREIPEIEGVSLRNLREDELDDLIKLINHAYGHKRLREDSVKEWFRIPSFNYDWIHVAESDGRIVSAVCTREDYKYNVYYRAKRCYIGPVGTHPNYRRRGIAKALLSKALNFFYELGFDSASLYVEGNNPAMRIYEGLGFVKKHSFILFEKEFH